MPSDLNIDALRDSALSAIGAAESLDALEAARVAHTGRRSAIVEILSGIGKLAPEERGPTGKAANAARKAIEAALDERHTRLEAAAMGDQLLEDRTDVTLPGDPFPVGALHLLTQVRTEIEDVFLGLGYRIADGPEIEDGYHNFTALNIPEAHPARSSSDTFYVAGHDDIALRPQTSPVQVRVMESGPPPVFIVSPGAVYRRDDVDATHSPMFHQLEGLAVDEGLTLSHLKGTLVHVARALLGDDVEYVVRPHFFPFTEPSIELYVRWMDRHGRGQWLELLGAGMVDPNVFASVGYDPERWTGFAFGMGIDRMAMVRYGLPDLRLLFENDLRFLEQFA